MFNMHLFVSYNMMKCKLILLIRKMKKEIFKTLLNHGYSPHSGLLYNEVQKKILKNLDEDDPLTKSFVDLQDSILEKQSMMGNLMKNQQCEIVMN